MAISPSIDTANASRETTFSLAKRYVPEIDGLRGIAILAVLFTHLFSFSMMGRTWTGFAKLVYQISGGGWLGVDLFFVLSGFLITRILISSRDSPRFFRNFYARRALRILPLYLLILAILWMFYANSSAFVGLGLLMSINLAPLLHIPFVSGGQALWSLAVEEHFYLIWPGVVKLARPGCIRLISALVCLIEPILRATTRFMVDDVYFYSWYRFDGLAWGALVAVVVTDGRLTRQTALRLAGGVSALSLLVMALGMPYGILHRGNRLGAALQFTVFEALFAGALLATVVLSGSRVTAFLRIRPLTLFGDLSYCLYVIHMVVLESLDFILTGYFASSSSMDSFSFIMLRAIIGLAVCVGIALASRRYFEQPILELKRHFV